MSEVSKCNRCGASLPPESPEGLCPRCLMALNLAPPTETADAGGPLESQATKPPPPPPLPVAEVAKLFPQLEILECLGRGGMGAVYKARQPRLDRLVALKILTPEKQGEPKFAERFEREARALARLHHPNIVTVYDFGEAQGNFYLLMEFVDGLTLRQLIQARKLSPAEALAIIPKICEALQYAHEQGIVHRDIKPENILLDKAGQLKIGDFGIAKIIGDGGRTNLTAEQVVGTPHYMAPEQVEHPQAVDHRADIFSLGVVFYEMLTGELPLGKFPPPSRRVQVDVRLDEIVLRTLEKEPERRYQHASVLKTDVETIAESAKFNEPAAKSQMVRFLEVLSNTTFTSTLAIRFATFSALGFLGCLGFLGFAPLPAMRGCFGFFGFTGFFGLIGVAFIVEFFARHENAAAPPPKTAGHFSRSLLIGFLVVCSLALSAGIALFVFNQFRGPNAVVTGLVTNAANGQPIAGARVDDNRYGAGPRRAPQQAWTDARGHYELHTWSEEHTVAASAPGYETKLAGVFNQPFAAGSEARLNFQLLPVIGSNTFIGKAWFPQHDSIEIISVERSAERIVVKGRYHLVSHERAWLALYITTADTNPVPTDSTQQRQISKGRGGFELSRPLTSTDVSFWHPGLPHVSMYADGKPFAALYFGTHAEALEESKSSWIINPPVSTPAGTSAFGPVIERVVSGEGDANRRFIDFDTGKLFAAADFFGAKAEPSPEETKAWHRETSIDAVGDTSPAVRGLVGFEMAAVPAPNEEWDHATPARLDYYLALAKAATPATMSGKGALPATFVIQTREGGRGLLQITGFTNNPPGVAIRYKLAQNSQ